MCEVTTGSRWTRKGKHYEVIDVNFTTKDPDSAGWHAGVMYRRADTQNHEKRHVRQTKDFLAKFEPLAETA